VCGLGSGVGEDGSDLMSISSPESEESRASGMVIAWIITQLANFKKFQSI
jgi:hypothetical protein